MNKTVIQLVSVMSVLLVLGWLAVEEIKKQCAVLLPVKFVRIEGAFQYIAKDEIRQVLREQVNTGLYNADIHQIQKSVMQLPWIENVRIKRVWPDAIDMKIVEQSPVAKWGEKGLLNEKGELFVPGNMTKFYRLPVINGPEGQEKKLLEIMQGLAVSLGDKKMKLTEFYVNERRAWNIKLENNLELKLGKNEPFHKFQRFLQTLAVLGDENLAKVKVVDLRYPNGYALTWRKGEESIDWEKNS